MYKCFSLSIKNNIAHLQMNRPEKRNSMILDFWTELPEIIADIDAGSKARVIVLSSTGPHFTAGLDKSLFAFVSEADSEANEDTRNIQSGAAFYHNVTQFQTELRPFFRTVSLLTLRGHFPSHIFKSLHRCLVANTGMPALSVVEDLDVFEDCSLGLSAGSEPLTVHQLLFQ